MNIRVVGSTHNHPFIQPFITHNCWVCYGHSEGRAGGPGPDCFHCCRHFAAIILLLPSYCVPFEQGHPRFLAVPRRDRPDSEQRARDCRSCCARQRPISCPGSPLDSQAARCSLQSPVRAGPSHCATVKQRSVTSPGPRSVHSLVHGSRSARLSSCIQLSGQRPARRLTAAATIPGPSHGATVEQCPVTCHEPHCVRSITVLTFLSRHQYEAAVSGEKSLSWPPSVSQLPSGTVGRHC